MPLPPFDMCNVSFQVEINVPMFRYRAPACDKMLQAISATPTALSPCRDSSASRRGYASTGAACPSIGDYATPLSAGVGQALRQRLISEHTARRCLVTPGDDCRVSMLDGTRVDSMLEPLPDEEPEVRLGRLALLVLGITKMRDRPPIARPTRSAHQFSAVTSRKRLPIGWR